jgi:5-methylcytosine-specific restriction endonuclease McrA
MTVAFPKPKDIKKVKPAVKVMRDGREKCDLTTKGGRDEYERRKRKAWEDQKHICAICHKPLNWADTTADHKSPRGMGGGSRDDRQENLAAVHWGCNTQKGSRRSGFYDVP